MIPRLRPEFILADLFSISGPSHLALLAEIRQSTHCSGVLVAPSGRAALSAALRAVGAKCAIVPAFNCWAVMEALKHADVQAVFVDVGDDLNAEPSAVLEEIERSPPETVLVLTHQFGVPQRETARLVAAARSRGLYVIEDGAAALGAHSDAGPVGTAGDIAIFSLQYTKTAIAGEGGVLLYSAAVAGAIGQATTAWRAPTLLESAKRLATLAAYAVLTHPAVYGWSLYPAISRVGTYNLRDARVSADRFVALPGNLQLRLATRTLRRSADILAARRRIAKRYLEGLAGFEVGVVPDVAEPAAAPIRFPLLVTNRARFVTACTKLGLDLGRSFSYTCSESGYPNAERVAARIVNLPLSARLESRTDEILSLVRTALADAH